MTRSPAPVANHLFPGSTAAERTQPKWPEITRTSFHGAWYVGLMVRVVLCRERAWDRVEEDVNVDCLCSGVVSILAIARDISEEAEG